VAAPADDRLHLGRARHAAAATPRPPFGITLDAFPAAINAMSASAAAYNAEIIRAGLQAVHHGQVEAAYAVGMRYGQVVRRIIVPQAVRIIIPPYMGNAISHTKNSSLASVITVPELMLTAQMIYSSTYRAIEILTVTGAIYLVLTSCLSALQMYFERVTSYEQRGLGEARRRRLRLDVPLPTQPA
jgi:polar amino acid transport system permease protein/cystine transport system permease protein